MSDLLGIDFEFSPQAIDRLVKSVEDTFRTNEILDEASSLLLNRIRTRFLAEKDPEGKPWVPSKAGLQRRAKGSTGTLFKTGRLFRSIQLSGAGPNERAITSDVPYGRQHQEGIGQVKRVFLGFSDADAQLIERLLVLRARKLST